MLAYVHSDSNIHLKDLLTGTDTAITEDANRNLDAGETLVEYAPDLDLKWSSDGALLAYLRITWPSYSLWVYDLARNTHREVLADNPGPNNPFSFRPGTHQLTYPLTYPNSYFTSDTEVDATKATSIWAIDFDPADAPVEIVPPEGGYTLVSPHWSADGRIVSFDEVTGRVAGNEYFAYYDMETGEYIRHKQVVSAWDLAPDGSWLVFDAMTWSSSSSMEGIRVDNLDWTGAQRISPNFGDGYAAMPILSPDGQQVAYFKGMAIPGEWGMFQFELFVQPVVETKEPQSLGMMLWPRGMNWTADGKSLIFSVGDSGAPREIISVRLEDTHVDKLADGESPAIRP